MALFSINYGKLKLKIGISYKNTSSYIFYFSFTSFSFHFLLFTLFPYIIKMYYCHNVTNVSKYSVIILLLWSLLFLSQSIFRLT